MTRLSEHNAKLFRELDERDDWLLSADFVSFPERSREQKLKSISEFLTCLELEPDGLEQLQKGVIEKSFFLQIIDKLQTLAGESFYAAIHGSYIFTQRCVFKETEPSTEEDRKAHAYFREIDNKLFKIMKALSFFACVLGSGSEVSYKKPDCFIATPFNGDAKMDLSDIELEIK